MPGLDSVRIDEDVTASDLLLRATAEHQRTLDVFDIGPLTNVAAAIEADDAFAGSVHHLYVMGGAFWMEQAELNIKSDPEAAAIVFGAGIPITHCGLDVTLRAWLREADLPRLREAADGSGPLLEDQVRRWWTYIGAYENNRHDPLAILPAIQPEMFRFEHCDVIVDVHGPVPGRTRLQRCGQGVTQIAADVELDAAEQEILRRITGR
jgi:inosine-uridine nucleoside N-ribohydrolase